MLYFNSQHIPELKGLNFSQRMHVVRTAADRLSPPVKIILNVVKLILLFMLFILIARAEGIYIIAYILLLVVLYPLITRPLTFALCRNQFAQVRRQLYSDL